MELAVVVIVVVAIAVWALSRRNRPQADEELGARFTEARRWVGRLSGQLGALTPSTPAARQALEDARQLCDTAADRSATATTAVAARLARSSAIEGMYYVRAARLAMALDPGPPLPALDGQAVAGAVDTVQTVQFDSRTIIAAPGPTADTPHHHPGGQVAGRPVPAGWYSEPWWADAAAAGQWEPTATALFTVLLSEMEGTGYDAEAFESGRGRGGEDRADRGEKDG